MCDKSEFAKLRDRVTAIEKESATHDAIQDEQLRTLFNIVKVQSRIAWAFAFVMLLALIYGALGPNGFNAVTKAAPNVINQN